MAFERVLGEKHEVKQHSQSPNINGNSVVRIADNFRSHVFLSAAVGFGTHASDRPSESKVSDFVAHVRALPSLGFQKQNVLWFDVAMNKIPFMNAFQPLHDLYHDFESVF